VGIYLAVRKAKYPASLTFVREQSVALLEDFAQKIPNLSVLYKDTPVEKNVVLISGYVVNDGALDITREMTEQPLTCILPVGSSWLEFKVTTCAPALHVASEFEDNQNVKLDIGLFRRDESFSFQALILLGDAHTNVTATDFAEKIIWQHRIASLGEVKTIQMPSQSKRSKTGTWVRRGIWVILAAFYFFMGISQITGAGPLGKHPSIIYQVESRGNTVAVRLIPNRDGSTTVKDVNTGTSNKVDLDSYSKTAKFTPVWSDKRDNTWTSIALGAFIFLSGVFFLFIGFINDYRRFKLRKLVAASNEKT
jgi:hypothetical protein